MTMDLKYVDVYMMMLEELRIETHHRIEFKFYEMKVKAQIEQLKVNLRVPVKAKFIPLQRIA